MNYIKMGVDFIGILMELYMIVLLFDHTWKRKENSRRGLCYAGFIVIMCISAYTPNLFYSMIVLFFLACCLLTFLYEAKWITKVFYIVIIYIGLLLSEMVVGLLMTLALGGSVEENVENVTFYTCGVVFSNFIFYVVVKFIILRRESRVNANLMSRIPLLLVLPIVTGYVVLVIDELIYRNESQMMNFMTALAVILLIGADILIYTFSDRMLLQETKLQRLSFAEEQIRQQEEHYRKMVENQKEIARIKHDMNNYLISLSAYISNNQPELALKKIEEKVQTLSLGNTIKCNNSCVEALLNGKDKVIKRENIRVDYRIDMPFEIEPDDIDVCIILGNLLDNAIEACSKFENDEEKWIEVSIGLKQELLAVVVRNPVCKGYEPLKGNKTIKAEKKAHGYGLDNVRMMAEKYNGSADFVFENYVFTSSVLLRNK